MFIYLFKFLLARSCTSTTKRKID